MCRGRLFHKQGATLEKGTGIERVSGGEEAQRVRKINMLTLAPLFFLFVWMLPADSIGVPFRVPPPASNQDIPLSMVEDSVDDGYRGCELKMMDSVLTHYLKKELRDRKFGEAWSKAAGCAKRGPKNKALTKDQIQAICVYTSDLFYREFNEAVRTQGPVYNTTFKFHSLHFLLTSAIKVLNSKRLCNTTYRRSDLKFIGRENQVVRFGTFASSSYRPDLNNLFGKETCFKIKTCFGADLRDYSVFKAEEEVLIPPYETFKVTKTNGKLRDCKVVYELVSIGAVSTLNCRALNP
ncbi:erythroblast NAD(P)(+)--arginine ADP-ribosyltransferase-like [Halichoeres trimaculatus]|uniref:erythroblast NAD(P)(+)--arginine ADP-ribosyltransferase-like n=1 Tax=Halichoeres trimaculatus TaxID=147232 RepID=UPI003D9E1348